MDKSSSESRKRNHGKCGVRLDSGNEALVFWPLSRFKTTYKPSVGYSRQKEKFRYANLDKIWVI